ncbi:hypothetical protein HAZT_HAZT002182 [Hyalella azteca]|uniref:WD and tetratricopeptide repeats protein 1 n=1 Tax=Hyalella azteca TaxID=294128 RepID=A0A6A0GRL2_HYAAZ|nr:hypothetical protein HAZT_HAZT002182 [Hyalella azteca]
MLLQLWVSNSIVFHPNFLSTISLTTTICLLNFPYFPRLLVSGSDDYQLMLWDVHSRKKLQAYTTSHSGNIFSVKFLPSCGTGLLVSGAGDKKVEVRDISTSRLLHSCTCHSSRVKRLATSPHLQHTFFSAAEDGTVLQYDLRTPHQCDRSPCNVVIDLRSLASQGHPNEVKCAAISPRDPNLLAVGANDPFVRIFDRRMIKLSKMQSGMPPMGMHGGGAVNGDMLPLGCCQYYVPDWCNQFHDTGHLPPSQQRVQRRIRSLATTYLSYSSSGQYLLANMGGENIYLYDTFNPLPPVRYAPPTRSCFSSDEKGSCDHLTETSNGVNASSSNGMSSSSSNGITASSANGVSSSSNGFYMPSTTPPSPPSPTIPEVLPPHVEALKEKASELCKTENWAAAVMTFNEALQAAPESALLFRNRAAVLIKRNWEGDTYAALRDSFRAMSLEPNHPKAYHRITKCLHKLCRFDEAKYCMDDFRKHHAALSRSPSYCALYTNILDEVFQSSVGNESSSSKNETHGSASSQDQIPSNNLSPEQQRRLKAFDYVSYYAGHCNTTTDIKEAVFLGQSGEFVAAGSDDGNMFIWETATGNLVRIMPADENIVNCVQCHPSASMVVTSGIDHTVKIWEPLGESQVNTDADLVYTTGRNQTRMKEDPLELLFMHMGDLTHVFSSNELGRGISRGSRASFGLSLFRREADDDDDDGEVPQHAFEFLRIPRPDGGSDGSGGAGGAAGSDVQCRTC